MRSADETPATVMVVGADGEQMLVGRLRAGRPGLALVDALLRAQLDARRRGARVALVAPSEELRGLLELTGLSAALGLEPRREAELGEQRREDEVVQPGDLPA